MSQITSTDHLTIIPKEIFNHTASFLDGLHLSRLATLSKGIYEKVVEFIQHPGIFKGREELLKKWCINLIPPYQKTCALHILTKSSLSKKVEKDVLGLYPNFMKQLERLLLNKLESKQISALHKEALSGLNKEELLNLFKFLKTPSNKKAFQTLQSFEDSHMASCLQKKTKGTLVYEGKAFNFCENYQQTYDKLLIQLGMPTDEQIEKTLAPTAQKMRANKTVIFPKNLSSRKELAECIASLLDTSELCLCLAQHYYMANKHVGSLATQMAIVKSIYALPQPLKKHFLAEKQQIIEHSKLSDDELREIVTIAQQPENLKALETLEDLLLVETNEYLTNIIKSHGPKIDSCVKKTCKEALKLEGSSNGSNRALATSIAIVVVGVIAYYIWPSMKK